MCPTLPTKPTTAYSPGIRTRRRSECPRIVWQTASHFLQGSSIVPERGKICPGAAASLLQIPRRPQESMPREMAFRYVELWPPHTQRFAKSKWAAHTRDTTSASDFMPARHGTTESVVARGCHLEIFRMRSTARRAVVDVLWQLLRLPPVCASLDSSATVSQDLRHVSFPLAKSSETRVNLKIWNYGQGAANMDLPCSFMSGGKPLNLRIAPPSPTCAMKARCGGVSIRLHFAGKSIPFQVQYCGGCEAPTPAPTLRFIVPDATLMVLAPRLVAPEAPSPTPMALLGRMHHFLVVNPEHPFLMSFVGHPASVATVDDGAGIWLVGQRS